MAACVAMLETQVPDTNSDWELVVRARAGDVGAFGLLFQRHRQRAYKAVIGVTRNPEAASDAVQDAFLKAYKKLYSFEGDSSFFTWFYRILMNAAIDSYRKWQHVAAQSNVVALEAKVNYLREPSRDPERENIHRETRDKISEAMSKLSAVHRAVLVLRDVKGLSYHEIAATLGCPKGTVMSRLFYARRYMREHLVAVGLDACS